MYKLYIGNKNYSSWSLRGWLAMKLSGAPFSEVMVALSGESGDARIPPIARSRRRRACPACTTARRSSGIRSRSPNISPSGIRACGPADPVARAWARSVCAEMHSGFAHCATR